jgi:hypothetical protein
VAAAVLPAALDDLDRSRPRGSSHHGGVAGVEDLQGRVRRTRLDVDENPAEPQGVLLLFSPHACGSGCTRAAGASGGRRVLWTQVVELPARRPQ